MRATSITDSYVLPVDVEVQAVQPHAHYRARDVRGEATLPDGTTRSLIAIKDWDFRWQHVYRFETPVRLPKGTTLSMRYAYDNSAANPRNPQQPPARARWGQRSSDEMGDLWVQVLTRDDDDLARLNRDFRPKVVAEDVQGYEVEIEKHPDDPGLHDDAALLYLELGRAEKAIAHFETSLKLKPGSAAAHYNLGTALTVARRLNEAGDRVSRSAADRSVVRGRAQQPRQRVSGRRPARRSHPRVQRGRAAAAGVCGRLEKPRGGLRDGGAVRARGRSGRHGAEPEAGRTAGQRNPRAAREYLARTRQP